jgi:hypothetical protein
MAYQEPTITNALGNPVVEQKQEFFIVFEGVTATEPELIDRSSYKITYIVDGQGNLAKPAEGAPSSFNILQNFTNDQLVTVVLDQATSENSTLGGIKTIESVGKPIPYIYSQNGVASASYENKLSFRPPDAPPSGSYDPVDNYSAFWQTSESYNNLWSEDSNLDIQQYTGAPNYPYGNVTGGTNWPYPWLRPTGFPNTGSGFQNGNFLTASWAQEFAWQGYNGDPSYVEDHWFDVVTTPDSSVAAITGSDGLYGIKVVETGLESIQLSMYVQGRNRTVPTAGSFAYTMPAWSDRINFYYQIFTSGSTDYENDYETFAFDESSISAADTFYFYDSFGYVETGNSHITFIVPSTQWINTVYNSFGTLIGKNFPFAETFKATIPKNKLTAGKSIRVLFAGNNLVYGNAGSFPPENPTFTPSFGGRYSFGINKLNLSITNQIPVPDNYYVENNKYWELEGSLGTSKRIRSTVQLGDFYNQFYLPTREQTEFGFDNVSIPFNIQPGDKIRFQYNPKKVYTIYQVGDPVANGGRIRLLLDRPLTDQEFSNFVIYRIDDSLANNIILNVKKSPVLGDPENPFTGIILPQYPSDNIGNNSDKILEQLKADGIIRS